MSTAVPQYRNPTNPAELIPCIQDGAVFEYDGAKASYIDRILADIDRDGELEDCILSYGPTSGLFTFSISVWKGEKLAYFNMFISDPLDLYFVREDDTLYLCGKTWVESPMLRCFAVSMENGNILLSNGKESIPYFGEQGVSSPLAPRALLS